MCHFIEKLRLWENVENFSKIKKNCDKLTNILIKWEIIKKIHNFRKKIIILLKDKFTKKCKKYAKNTCFDERIKILMQCD